MEKESEIVVQEVSQPTQDGEELVTKRGATSVVLTWIGFRLFESFSLMVFFRLIKNQNFTLHHSCEFNSRIIEVYSCLIVGSFVYLCYSCKH